jgi:alkanesulfonate monooxygenase SsuD/methylene tetrahydromethanopterin reductase-like flavin-dependent oxidoreductase (luciferase family)
MEGRWDAAEEAAVMERSRCAAVGSPATVRDRLETLLERTAADEIIATAQIYDHAARLRSFEIAADVLKTLVSRQSSTAYSPVAAEQRSSRP